MTYDPSKHHRRSIRLKGYDYTTPGAYFVTIVTHHRECLFGEIENGEMRLSRAGEIAARCWEAISAHFASVGLDLFVVMPNHLHGIIIMGAGRGEASANTMPEMPTRLTADASPLRRDGTQPGSLPAIIQNFKSVSTRCLNALCATPGVHVWQRDYYEHIVRDEAGLTRLRGYIQNNPSGWALDELHPVALPSG